VLKATANGEAWLTACLALHGSNNSIFSPVAGENAGEAFIVYK